MSTLEGGTAPAAAVSASGMERLKLYYERNEGRVAAAFFAAGFVFDMLTVGAVDSWAVIAQQAVYLAVIMTALLQMFVEQDQPPRQEGQNASGGFFLVRWYYEYRNALIHFLMGALLNIYAIFYFKSSSLLVSFGFLGFLVIILLANEVKRVKSMGLSVKFTLLSLCMLSFFAYLVPVLIGSIGLTQFLFSMAVGCVPLAIGAWLVGRATPERLARARRQILLPLGCVLVGFLTFYLFRLIPPVPLSIPFIGVYHQVERAGDTYRLSHERPAWRLWHNGDQHFLAQPGDRVYVYFRIFSPARFADQVQMRWHWKDPARGWVVHDTIPIRIVGGRELGFRGYGFKANYQPGDWKVQVETLDGREIGRVYFEVSPIPQVQRTFLVEVD